MKTIRVLLICIFCLLIATSAQAATQMFGRTALIGGTKSVDNITAMANGDLCTVIDSSKVLYFYLYDSSNTDSEDSPEIIEPDSGAGAWELITSFRIGASSEPSIIFRDSDFSNTEAAKIYAQAVDADNGDIFIQIEQGGSLVTVLTFDESDDQWETTKDFTSTGTIEAATLTEGGNVVYNSTETPGGELGGTWASPTIDNSITVTGWTMGASAGTTPAENDNDTSLATTAYVQTEISGLAVAPTNITPVDTADENATFYPILVDGATGSQATETDGEFTFNPSTGVLTATEFSGGGANLTNVDAATGDSATAFFDAGEIADAQMSDTHSHGVDSIDAITEIAAALKSGSDGTLVTGTAGTNTYAAVWNADGDLVDGPGVPLTSVATADISDVSVTQTELAELETIGATTISANQWATLGGIAETLGSGELDLLDGETDLANQSELNAVAALVDTDDKVIAIINDSPATQIGVPAGGTGAGTFTDGGILLGSGTGAFTALGAATNGQIPIGDGTTDPVLATLTGTASEVTVTNGAGTITLSLPNDAGTDISADLEEEVAAGSLADNSVYSADINTIVSSFIWVGAGMTPDGTQCAAASDVQINSGPYQSTIVCADNDGSTLYGNLQMPDSWDAGNLVFELAYIQTAADTGPLQGDITIQCRGAGETVNNTWESEVAMDDAGVTGSNAVDHLTSGNVSGTCVAGDTVYWRWQMDAAGTTTAVATLNFVGMKAEWVSNVGD